MILIFLLLLFLDMQMFSTSVEMLKKGANDFIEKPFHTEHLLTKIRGLLNEKCF